MLRMSINKIVDADKFMSIIDSIGSDEPVGDYINNHGFKTMLDLFSCMEVDIGPEAEPEDVDNWDWNIMEGLSPEEKVLVCVVSDEENDIYDVYIR